MKLTTKNVGSNYLAKVVKLPKPFKHPNADKLQCVVIDHNTVITGLNAQEGDLYVYFPLECAINLGFLGFTNSFSDPTLNADKTKKGFFHEKGRVKAVKLRGQPSEGYVVPVRDINEWLWSSGIDVIAITDSDVGTEFDSVEGELLCEKYVIQTNWMRGMANAKPKKKEVRHNRIVDGQFNFHSPTGQLKKNIHLIHPDSLISVTHKLHGTSLVAANLLVNRKLAWYEKLLKKVGVKIQDKEYGLVYSSRSVIKNQYDRPKTVNHWYKEDIWGLAAKELEPSILPGISIYAEIVGYTPGGKGIQKGYDYGCEPGQFKTYVYRITQTNTEGNVLEFTTGQIKEYCQKFGLNMIPLHSYTYGHAWGLAKIADENLSEWQTEFLTTLSEMFLERKCSFCKNDVPAEGIVVRVEGPEFQAFKLKSFAFFEQESKQLDNGEVDLETSEESGIIEPVEEQTQYNAATN